MRLRYIIGLLFLLACGESYKESKILPLETIVFDNLEKQPISSLFSKQNTKYILLEFPTSIEAAVVGIGTLVFNVKQFIFRSFSLFA